MLAYINQGIPSDLQERYNALITKRQNLTKVGVGFRASTQPTATTQINLNAISRLKTDFSY